MKIIILLAVIIGTAQFTYVQIGKTQLQSCQKQFPEEEVKLKGLTCFVKVDGEFIPAADAKISIAMK